MCGCVVGKTDSLFGYSRGQIQMNDKDTDVGRKRVGREGPGGWN